MADGKPIRISKSHIYRRRIVDGLKKPFLKVRLFIRRLLRKQKVAIIHIKRRSGSYHRLESPGSTSGLTPSTSGGSSPSTTPIRIKRRPIRDRGLGEIFSSTIGGTTPSSSPSRPRDVTASNGLSNCPACRQPLQLEEPKAICRNIPEHVVHKRCVKFMKGKCPQCGGSLR